MAIYKVKRQTDTFVCDGTQTTFPFDFKVLAPSDIGVNVNTSDSWFEPDESLTYEADFTVTLNDNQDTNPGGNVALKVAPEEGTRLVVLSQVNPVQTLVITRSGGFYPDSLNNAFDRAIALIQELKDSIKRALTVPPTSNQKPEDVVNDLMNAQRDAQESAEEAKGYRDEAQQFRDNTAEYAEATLVIKPYAPYLETIATDVAPNMDAVITVAGIKDQVVTTAEIKDEIVTVAGMQSDVKRVSNLGESMDQVLLHSDAIKVVADDLQGELLDGIDLGRITDPVDPISVPTSGNTRVVAENMDKLKDIHEALPELLKAEGYKDQAQESAEQAGQSAEEAKEASLRVRAIEETDYQTIFENGLQ